MCALGECVMCQCVNVSMCHVEYRSIVLLPSAVPTPHLVELELLRVIETIVSGLDLARECSR